LASSSIPATTPIAQLTAEAMSATSSAEPRPST
jgi:hypothetical protein